MTIPNIHIDPSSILYTYTAERRDVLYPYTAERRDVQPNTSRLEAVYGHSLIINPYQGMYQEIHPCMAGSIDSVKINTSLLMMREWLIRPRRPRAEGKFEVGGAVQLILSSSSGKT